MAQKNRDENIGVVDRNLERVVFKLMQGDDTLDRASALKLVAKRALYATTQRVQRPFVNIKTTVLE